MRNDDGLAGRRIVRVDRPAPALVCLTLSGPAPAVLVLTTLERLPPCGLVPERPRGEPARGATTTLRAALEGRTVKALVVDRTRCRVELAEDGEPFGALEVVRGRSPCVRLVPREATRAEALGAEDALGDDDGREPRARRDADAQAPAALAQAGSAMLEAFEATVLALRKDAYRAALTTALGRARRARDAAFADARRVDAEASSRRDAELLLASPAPERRGRTEVVVLDYFEDPPRERAIALDPATSPRERATAIFARLRKLERGLSRSLERVDALEARLVELDDARAQVDAALDHAALDAVAAAHPLLDCEARTVGRRPAASARTPNRSFVSARGARIRVGRGAADNDRLTGDAHPRDLFLHVRGAPGSHVILVHAGRGDHHPDDRLDAATLAAHFSSQRGEAIVEVTTALVKHVRKPRGAPVGTVRLDQEAVIVLRVEPARLTRLLASETSRWH